MSLLSVICSSFIETHKSAIKFSIYNEYITDKNDIANSFNEFFVNIGQNMAQDIYFENASFDSYLTENITLRLSFQATWYISILREKTNKQTPVLTINQQLANKIYPDYLKSIIDQLPWLTVPVKQLREWLTLGLSGAKVHSLISRIFKQLCLENDGELTKLFLNTKVRWFF